MKFLKWVLLGLAVLIAGIGVFSYFRPDLISIGIHPVYAACARNDQIPADQRRAVESAAIGVVNDLLGPDSRSVFAELSSTAKASGPDNWVRLGGQLRGLAPFTPPSVERTYVIHNKGPTSDQPALSPCGQFDDVHQWDAVAIGVAKDEAHVLVSTDAAHDRWTFAIWLESEEGHWRARGIHFGSSIMAGHSGEELWRRAREQRQRGRTFSATVLYDGAAILLDRGPYFRLGVREGFDKDVKTFPRDAALATTDPQTWALGGKSYRVSNSELIGAEDGKLLLRLNWHPATWTGDADAERSNREFISAFMAAHPDWGDAVDVIVARAWKPGADSGYATVFDKGRGFLPPPVFRDLPGH